MTTCLNLLAIFGDRYRITWDPSYDAKGVHRDNLDPWYAQIPCRYGTIYPVGGDQLAAEIDYHRQITKAVALIPGVICIQDGDGEKTYRFDVDLFDQVAAILQPRRKRHLSAAQRERLAEAGAETRFPSVRCPESSQAP